jgi:RND family efflux transporter MFP subunit
VASRAVDIGPPAVERMWNFKIARLVEEGTHVKAGDMLVEFDGQQVNRHLGEHVAERDKAQEELNKRKLEYDVQLRDLKIKVEEARVNLEKARHKSEAQNAIAAVVSPQELREVKIQLELAQSADLRLNEKLRATERMRKAELAALEGNLETARRRVAHLEAQQKALTVVAPTAGVVIFKRDYSGEKKQVGQSAWRMQTIMQIPDLATLRLEAMVEEANAGGIRVGQSARVRLDAFPERPLKGKVVSVGNILHAKRWDTPIKVIDAIVEVEPKGERLLPGMTGEAQIEVARIPNVLQVPLKAVHEREGRTVIFAEGTDGKPLERVVQVGARGGDAIEIREGVKEGEAILP